MLNSLLSIEKETGESMWSYKKEISFMRKLILEGKWIEAEEFFKPLVKNKKFNYKAAMLSLKKQRLFELIENSDEANENVLEAYIKEIQEICSKEVFEEIMMCLNVTSINEINKYKNWTILNGRFQCFDIIKELLINVYPSILSTGYDKENKVKKGLLIDVMNKVMETVNKDKTIDQRITSMIEAAEVFVSNSNQTTLNDNKCDDKYVTFNPKALNKEIKKDNIIALNPPQPILMNNAKNIPITQDESLNLIKGINKKDGNDKDKSNNSQIKKDKKISANNINNKDQCDNSYHKKENDIKNNALIDDNSFYSPYNSYKYDVSSFKLDRMITDTNPIRTSCFSSNGDFFALGTNSKSLKIYDMTNVLTQFNNNTINNTTTNSNSNNTPMPLVFEKTNHHLGSLYCLDWSTSGKLIASGSNDQIIKIIVVPDLISWSNKSNILELSMEGHKGTIRSLIFDPLSDYSLYSGGTIDYSIMIWDTEKGTSKSQLIGHLNDIHSIKWSNNFNLLGSSGKDKSIHFWDVRNGQIINTIKTLNYDDINDISIHSTNQNTNNTVVAAAHNGGFVTIWDYNRNSLIKEISFENKSEMRSIAFSPDGRYLVVGGFNKKITVIDVKDNYKIVNTLEHLDKVVSVKWHPEKPIIVSTSVDKTARVWLPQVY